MSTGLKVFFGVVAAVFCYAFMKAEIKPPPQPAALVDVPSPALKAEPPIKPVEVKPSDLFLAYVKNEIGADARYKGKRLKVTGEIFAVGKNNYGNFYVTLHDPNIPRWVVHCLLEKNDPRAGDLNVGDAVTVAGEGGGLERKDFSFVYLMDCTLPEKLAAR